MMRGLLFVLLGMLVAITAACMTAEEIEDEIEAANYCDTPGDCVVIYPGCPLGCWSFVNESEEERLLVIINEFHDQNSGETCMYDCSGHGEVTCTDGRCEAESL
jgi:hypothetical protein